MNSIDTSQLLSQLRAVAAQAQSAPVAPLDSAVTASQATNFSSLLSNSIESVNNMSQNASKLTTAFELGDPNVTLPQVMVAKAKAGIAFDGMVTVRNKMVEAYQEIMRMQV